MADSIKIPTSFKDVSFYSDTNCVRVFLHLLLTANFKDINHFNTFCPAGSSILSLNTLSVATDLSEKQVRLALKKIEDSGLLKIERAGKGQILKLLNWSDWTVQENKRARKGQPSVKKTLEMVDLVYPFDSDIFMNSWNIWKDYKKKEHKFNYASIQSEQAALKELSELCSGDENIAIKIIHQSMAKGWKGLFKLNMNKNEERDDEQDRELAAILRDERYRGKT